jgi:hypothetical protein
MRRRELIALISIAVLHGASRPLSSQVSRKARIGYLTGAVRAPQGGSLTGSLEILKEGLHQLGWREGETFEVEARFADGDFLIIPRLAGELVALRPDVIVATGASEAKALQGATQEVPIVFLQVPDPLSVGLWICSQPLMAHRLLFRGGDDRLASEADKNGASPPGAPLISFSQALTDLWPDQGNQHDADAVDEDGERQTDLEEIGEAVFTWPVDHQA